MDIEKEFKEKFCYERMDFDGRNRHHYINPTVVEKPQFIIDWIKQQVSVEPEVKPACGKKDKTMSWKEDLENKKMFAAISTRTGITYKVLEIEDTIKFIEENFILKAGQVEPEVKINLAEWISVKDRLPEIGKAVIIFEPHCLPNEDKGIGVYIVDNNFSQKRSDGTYWITHWMPLPEPPK